MKLVTKDNWGVSYTSGSHLGGVRLSVHRYMGQGKGLEKCPDCDGMVFPLDDAVGYCEAVERATEQATKVALDHGHLQPYRRRR